MRFKSDEINEKFEFIRILHLSDFHFPEVKFEDGRSIDKDKGYQSPHISVLKEVYKIIDNVDFILISGDFTSDANIEEFDKCLSFICEKFSHHNVKILSVFGNHDLKRGCGNQKFTNFLKKTHEYPDIDFGGLEICEQRKLTNSSKQDLDLLLINTCKNSSDNPIIPKNLEKCVTKPILQFLEENVKETVQLDDEKLSEKKWEQIKEKMSKEIWNQIKEEIEKTTLIDDIYFEDEDYITLGNELAGLESVICLSHYNLLSFSGSDKLNSFFSDQGKFRDIFVNHKNTVVYLSGHTHTQEFTVIENPKDHTNKLVCITSPPFFKINSSMVNGFNIVDMILRKDAQNIYKPVGCKIKKIDGDVTNRNVEDCVKIRFSRNLIDLEFSNDERKVIKALRYLIRETGEDVRVKSILKYLNSSETQETEKFDGDNLHEILMYLWWIGVIDGYSAMKRENELEGELTDYVRGVLCLPLSY